MRRLILLLTVVGMLGAVVTAQAETRPVRFYGLGPRIGFSIDPDQFVIGGHGDFGDLFPHTNILLPVVEIGVGNDLTVASIGSDLLFRFVDTWGEWTPYLGGELAFIIVNVDRGQGIDDDTNTDLGLSGIFGVEKGIGDNNKFGLELKFAIVDAPDVKFTAHWTFGH